MRELDWELWESAHALVNMHGPEAAAIATACARKMLAQSNEEGAAVAFMIAVRTETILAQQA